jgi:hypothetical protein
MVKGTDMFSSKRKIPKLAQRKDFEDEPKVTQDGDSSPPKKHDSDLPNNDDSGFPNKEDLSMVVAQSVNPTLLEADSGALGRDDVDHSNYAAPVR